MQIEDIAAKGQLIQVSFAEHSVANNQTDAEMHVQETANGQRLGIARVSLPFAANLVAMTVDLSGAATTGQAVFAPTINGTKIDSGYHQTITTQQQVVIKFERDAIDLLPGDKIGVKLTTNNGWDGTTLDGYVTLYLLAQMTGI